MKSEVRCKLLASAATRRSCKRDRLKGNPKENAKAEILSLVKPPESLLTSRFARLSRTRLVDPRLAARLLSFSSVLNAIGVVS